MNPTDNGKSLSTINNTHFVYLLIRMDLTVEQALVQAAHATLAAGYVHSAPDTPPNLIALAVPNEDALLGLGSQLHASGIEHELFHEPDYNLGYTALATRPILADSHERRLFESLSLWSADMCLPTPPRPLENQLDFFTGSFGRGEADENLVSETLSPSPDSQVPDRPVKKPCRMCESTTTVGTLPPECEKCAIVLWGADHTHSWDYSCGHCWHVCRVHCTHCPEITSFEQLDAINRPEEEEESAS